MLVIECNECGEPVQAAGKGELTRLLGEHLKAEHDIDSDADELEELVESEAYEAMDS